MDRWGSKRVFGRCTTFNRFAGLGTLHALRTLVFRSRTAWLGRVQGRERDVRDESASVCLGGAGRQCIEAVLPLATDEVRVDVRAPSRSAVFRYGQHVSAVERGGERNRGDLEDAAHRGEDVPAPGRAGVACRRRERGRVRQRSTCGEPAREEGRRLISLTHFLIRPRPHTSIGGCTRCWSLTLL